MNRLLIAEDLSFSTESIAKYFSDEWKVQICGDTFETIEALREQPPDAMIIIQQLENPNAHTILSNSFPDIPPTVLVATAAANNDEICALSRWGADCILELPYNPKQLKQTLTILHKSHDMVAKRIAQHLRVLGVNAGPGGYFYLLMAVTMFHQDMTLQLHNDVYCRIAQDAGVDERSVEKAIRTLIHNAFNRRNPGIWAKYFPVDAAGEVSCPTNKEFVMTLAQQV